MKKKIFSTFFAVSLSLTMAIPAIASSTSSLEGNPSDVDKIIFTEDSYTIKQDKHLDILNKTNATKSIVKAFIGNKTFVPDADFEFDLECSDGSFVLSDDVVYACGDSGEATLKAVLTDNEKISATAKLVAEPKAEEKDKKTARGFLFDNKNYSIVYAADKTEATASATSAAFSFTLKSKPKDSIFTENQVDSINKAVIPVVEKVLDIEEGSIAPVEFSDDIKSCKYTIPSKELTYDKYIELTEGDKTSKKDIEVKVLDFDGISAEDASCVMNLVEGKVARNIFVPSKVDIQVGDNYNLGGDVKAIPSSANIPDGIKSKVTFDEDYLYDDADYSDYAIVDKDGLVSAISVGKNKIVASYTYMNTENEPETVKATTIVNVVPLDSNDLSDALITPTTGEIKVGEKMTITAKNAGNSEVKWNVDDGKLATVTMKGASTTVKALAAGNVTVTAKVGDKVIGTSKVSITSDAKPVVILTKPGFVKNPQTGDSIFSNLFS